MYTRRNVLIMCFLEWFTVGILQIPAFYDLGEFRSVFCSTFCFQCSDVHCLSHECDSHFCSWSFSFDLKSHGCLWNRVFDKLYMHFATGIAEVLTAIVVLYCYLQIFLYVRKTRNNVSSFLITLMEGII